MSRRLTQEEFIERAKRFHPEYDYSLVNYVNNKTKVKIICPVHGLIEVRPDGLLRGVGCHDCCSGNKLTNNEFIEKAKYVHNNFFTYDKCYYVGYENDVTVTCPYHGDFNIKAKEHLQGKNCKECQKEDRKHEIRKLPKKLLKTYKLTTKEFIEKAHKIWGEQYSYEHVIYEKTDKHVLVTCPIHGDFPVTPNHFFNKRGCPKCGKNYNYSNEEFIEKMKEINGDRYTYEKTKYITTHKPVIITCKKHGDFSNEPSNLLRGQGCPICQESILEKEIFVLLEKIGIKFETEKKFKWLGKQSLDFYLPDYNIAIECQGIQHFEEVPFFYRMTLKDRLELDNKKLELCKEKKIKILYYTNKKKYIDNNKIFNLNGINEELNKLLNRKKI